MLFLALGAKNNSDASAGGGMSRPAPFFLLQHSLSLYIQFCSARATDNAAKTSAMPIIPTNPEKALRGELFYTVLMIEGGSCQIQG